jgi:molybdopterin synthase sulfur carrier subunit
MSVRVEVLYFAALRDAARRASESIETDAPDAAALHDALRARHGWALPRDRLRVAIDGAFARWDARLRDGATVAFIPPVSGG